jgi:hypothetical protein
MYSVSVCLEMRIFCLRSRTAKKISTGICLISESPLRSAYLRVLFFSYDAEIGQVSEPARLRKDHLWTGTS